MHPIKGLEKCLAGISLGAILLFNSSNAQEPDAGIKERIKYLIEISNIEKHQRGPSSWGQYQITAIIDGLEHRTTFVRNKSGSINEGNELYINIYNNDEMAYHFGDRNLDGADETEPRSEKEHMLKIYSEEIERLIGYFEKNR
jgi:hypothetical protein